MYPRRDLPPTNQYAAPRWRLRIWYGLIIGVFVIFGIRLFYLQVLRHSYYTQAARVGQYKEYKIQPERGIIEAYDGKVAVPLVLNEKKYTVFADPKYIEDPASVSRDVAATIGGEASDYEVLMRADSRYQILKKKLDKTQKEKLDALKLKGVGTREESYRTYPQGSLAAHILGFVNDEGEGKYGVEQFFNEDLQGTPGELKAITDVQGVPLVANKDNIVVNPKSGSRVTLTMDMAMQRQLEDILKSGLEAAKSGSGSALIIEAKTGAVKAMSSYPTFNPAEFFNVEDANVFSNTNVTGPMEVGSIMKPLTTAAALNSGAVGANATFHDNRSVVIDGVTIRNVEEDGGTGTKGLKEILQLSLNTGATWLLQQMGGGEVNKQARERWYDYLTNHYQFGKTTGIELGGEGYELAGVVPDPNDGFGLNIQYANMSFGQGMTATTLQMASALSSIVNGGTYYKPRIVDQLTSSSGAVTKVEPKAVKSDVVSKGTSEEIIRLMQNVITKNKRVYGMTREHSGYTIGGKTGTAQVPKPEGGYYEDRYNGTFMGFVGGSTPEYVIVVRVNEPKIGGYAGSKAAGPVFVRLAEMLIDNFGITPAR